MKLLHVIYLILLLGLLILAGAAAGQAAAPITSAKEGAGEGVNLADVPYDDYFQLQYRLKIIEINEKGQQQFYIDQLLLNKDIGRNFKFYKRQELLEVIDTAGINKLVATYDQEKSLNYKLAKPEIIVTMHENAIMRVGEEKLLLPDQEDIITEKSGLYISLFPRQISSNREEIMTELIIRDEGQAYFVTTVRMRCGEEMLAGLLTVKEGYSANSLARQNKNRVERVFAIYLETKTVNILDGEDEHTSDIINLAGLDSLFLNNLNEDKITANSHILLLGGDNYSLESYLVLSGGGVGFLYDGEADLIRVEINKNLLSQLKLGGALSLKGESNLQLALGLREEVMISSDFSLAAGVYPLAYIPGNEEYGDGYWWFKAEKAFKGDWVLLLQYDSELGKKAIRLGVGKGIGEKSDFILVYKFVPEGEGLFQGGLRLKF